ncbi:PGF-pre-PGF domain-containing protein [Halorubrum sp. ASP121]|uniref:CARDB domain-containing protein n=1 Tax=Halorubrum sp. ASP121 TaxID=1855858 RepID=UPI0010F6EB3F|nr:CARDB domain-containing protein [Halorubrum sp. ASP121]TKX50742.1 PGF-pre-PGF domain-containing protein [Halorubrum sp. ASP121]
MSRTPSKSLTVVIASLLVVSAVAGAPAAVAQDGPPPTPAAYFGEITVDGEPAPEGVEVTAYVDGELRGSLTTTQIGAYGGSSAFDRKLVVEGTDADAGATVEFRVNGEVASTDDAIEWEPGEVRRVDLAVGDGADGGDGSDGSDGGDGSDGADGSDGSDGSDGGDGSGGGDGSDGADTDGGGGGGAVAPPPSGDAVETTAASVEMANGTATLSAGSVGTDEVVEADLPNGTATPNATLAALSVAPSSEILSFGVEATAMAPSELPDGVRDHEGAETVSVFEIEPTTFDSGAVESAEIRFETEMSAFSDAESPEGVALYRYVNNRWRELPTTYEGDGVYVAETPGFSYFAVGGPQPDVTVAEASLGAAEVSPESETEVAVRLRNAGDAEGTTNVGLRINGELVADRTITVPADATRRVTFTPRFPEVGEYDVAVGSTEVGTVSVVESTDDADSGNGGGAGATGDGSGDASDDGAPLEGFGVGLTQVVGLVSLLLVVAGGFLLLRRE